MLAWPAFALLKQSAPDWHLTALVPAYTAPLAKICPYIDEVIIDTKDKVEMLKIINIAQFDAVINFFSNTYNASLMFKARIPFRMAPATKIIQFLYNHRVVQRRSQSAKPEFVYNMDLARAFLEKQNIAPKEPKSPYLQFSPDVISQQKDKLSTSLRITQNLPWIFVHAGSGGSANNLTLEQYAHLITQIQKEIHCVVILSAGPAEIEKIKQLYTLLTHQKNIVIYDKNDGLTDFAQSLACASIFIAGSTGPLHICGALNIPTIGFYPSKRSATPLRWQPINEENRHLAFAAKEGKATEDDLTSIDMEKVIKESMPFIRQWCSFI
ncbi:glycosyltransferase family 9 protein [Pelistega ratti]|nr:glycosyltransferase family 9 protein [Pelistega ratti]